MKPILTLLMVLFSVCELPAQACSSARLYAELRRLLSVHRFHNCEIHFMESETDIDQNKLVMLIYARDLSLCRRDQTCDSSTATFVLSIPKQCLERKDHNLKLQFQYGYQTETQYLRKMLKVQLDVFGQIHSLELQEKAGLDHHLLRRVFCRPELS